MFMLFSFSFLLPLLRPAACWRLARVPQTLPPHKFVEKEENLCKETGKK